jgi:hypothetical protein
MVARVERFLRAMLFNVFHSFPPSSQSVLPLDVVAKAVVVLQTPGTMSGKVPGGTLLGSLQHQQGQPSSESLSSPSANPSPSNATFFPGNFLHMSGEQHALQINPHPISIR